METIDWTYNDYLTYLLLFAAREDYEVDKEEIDWIINRVGEEEYLKVNEIFKQHEETEHLEVIQNLGKEYCQDGDCKEKILADLKQLFISNGKFSDLEQVLFIGLRKLL